MAKQPLSRMRTRKDPYWNGVFTGVFIGCFFISIVIFCLIEFQGLQVAVNPEQLARMAQVKIQNEARRDIPQVLETIKKELPDQIDNHLEELDGLTIGFGNSQVKLPPEVLLTIKNEFHRIFETAIVNTLNNYDTVAYEKLIGRNAYEMMENTIKQEIIGKTYLIKCSQLFSVPVKIVGSANSNNQIGI